MARQAGLRGRVRITAAQGPANLRVTVVGYLASPPDITPGVGGWEATARAQQRPARWWAGTPETTMTLNLILDRSITPDVQTELRQLVALGRRRGTMSAPQAVRVSGDIFDPYTLNNGLWVITGLNLGDRIVGRNGSLRQQHVTVTLADYEPVTAIRALTVKRTRSAANKPRKRTITTRKGDTLRKIAVRELGQSTAWQKIRTWNPKQFKGKGVGADEPLKPGLRLVLK